MNQKLSQKSQDLFNFLRNEYIESGYLYSGSYPYTSLKEKGYGPENMKELQAAGLLQVRNCEEYAFELSSVERQKLVSQLGLCSIWFEAVGKGMLLDIQEEIRDVKDLQLDKKTGLINVSTMKVAGDQNKPDTMNISTPFSLGQVIQVEYDLPKNLRYSGYSNCNISSPGKAIGEFMVTDVICNLLVHPHQNMIELQSMDSTFNKIHADSRVMLLSEDVVMKRMRKPSMTLSDQIQSASARTAEVKSTAIAKEKESPEI